MIHLLWKSMVVFAIFVTLLLVSGLAEAQQTRARIYDDRGRYQGRLVPDYAGRCCAIIDRRGERQGRIEQPRSSRDNRGTRK